MPENLCPCFFQIVRMLLHTSPGKEGWRYSAPDEEYSLPLQSISSCRFSDWSISLTKKNKTKRNHWSGRKWSELATTRTLGNDGSTSIKGFIVFRYMYKKTKHRNISSDMQMQEKHVLRINMHQTQESSTWWWTSVDHNVLTWNSCRRGEGHTVQTTASALQI